MADASMPSWIMPSWMRIILLVLTLASFIPQCHRIVRRGDFSGISLTYVYLNAINFTEMFAISLVFVTQIRYSPDIRDIWINLWIDFLQHALTFSFWLAILIAFTSMSSRSWRIKCFALTLYIAFALLAILPVLFPTFAHGDGIGFILGYVLIAHILIINPIVVILVLGIAINSQARLSSTANPASSSLSVTGLGAQAAMFALLAIFWPSRPPVEGDFMHFELLYTYDALFYAIAQAALCLVVAKQHTTAQDLETAAQMETEPLLRHREIAGQPMTQAK